MNHQLAQINIGRLRHAVDAPELADFVNNLDRINALAESEPGFMWRLVGGANNALDIVAFDDPLVQVNMSVWESLETLAAFVYRTAHRDFLRRRREWFQPMDSDMALWWVPQGHRPSPAEGRARLELLQRVGPSAAAFTFRAPFSAPQSDVQPRPILDQCA